MIDTTVFQNKTAVYYTLGCKLNFSETSTIGKTLKEAGVRTVRKGEKADICVINTCSVTEVADKKCRQAIHRLVKNHPGAFVVVTGCYAQLKPEQVAAIEGVDVVLGAEEKGRLLDYLGDLSKNEKGEDKVFTLERGDETATMTLHDGERGIDSTLEVSNDVMREFQERANMVQLKDKLYDYVTDEAGATRCTYFVRYNTGDTLSGVTCHLNYPSHKVSGIVQFFEKWLNPKEE